MKRKLLLAFLLIATFGYSQDRSRIRTYTEQIRFNKIHVDSLVVSDSSLIYFSDITLDNGSIDTLTVAYIGNTEANLLTVDTLTVAYVADVVTDDITADSLTMTGILSVDNQVTVGGWGYTGEHIVIPETSSNTNAGIGLYSMVDDTATAGKTFAGTYSRMLAMTDDQVNQSTMVGIESQFRLRDVDIANGVHAGLWAYAEQSGTSALSGGGTFDAISATVESESGFSAGATEHITGITLDSSINGSATINASANFSAIYIKSNGKDWFNGLKIAGVTNDILLHNGTTINNSTADLMTITEATVDIDGAFTASSVTSDAGISGTTITGTAKLDIDQAVSGGSAVGNIIKLTQAAGETYTSTTAGLTVKNYDADGTVVHGSDENTGLAVFMKQLSASLVGGENSILSLHSHSSAVGKLDHGLIMYPDTVGSAIAVRDAVIDYGLDFADRDNVTVNNAEIRGSNGETIDNAVDGTWGLSGNVSTGGMVLQDSTWHAYGGFEDSSVTISLSIGVWANVTNVGGDLFNVNHSNGFSMSGDTLTIEHAGHYAGSLSLTLSGSNNDELYIRVYNITQDDSTYKIGFTGVGATAFRNVSMPIYFDNTAGDEYVLQILNTDSNDDAIARSAIFYMNYLHD